MPEPGLGVGDLLVLCHVLVHASTKNSEILFLPLLSSVTSIVTVLRGMGSGHSIEDIHHLRSAVGTSSSSEEALVNRPTPPIAAAIEDQDELLGATGGETPPPALPTDPRPSRSARSLASASFKHPLNAASSPTSSTSSPSFETAPSASSSRRERGEEAPRGIVSPELHLLAQQQQQQPQNQQQRQNRSNQQHQQQNRPFGLVGSAGVRNKKKSR